MIFLLNNAVELTLLMSSGSVFQRWAPLDMRELAPIVFVFTFHVCNRFFVRNSYFVSLFSKDFHINDGFLLIDTYIFKALIFANSLCDFAHLFL